MGKKRKASSTAALVPPPMTSRRVARQVTTAFHRLSHAAEKATSSEERSRLEAELEAMGGRARYQEASVLSTALYSTSKWVLKVLRRRGVMGPSRAARPRALEVGAVTTRVARGCFDVSSTCGVRDHMCRQKESPYERPSKRDAFARRE